MTRRLELPERLSSTRSILRGLVDQMEEGHTDTWYAFATLTERVPRSVHISSTETVQARTDCGVVLRITAGQRSFEWATNDLDEQTLTAGARALRARAERQDATHGGWRPRTWSEEGLDTLHEEFRAQLPATLDPHTEVHFGSVIETHPDETSLADLGDLARSCRARIERQIAEREAPIAATFVAVVQNRFHQIFVDRHKNMSQALVFSYVRVLSAGQTGQQAYVTTGGQGGVERLDLTDDHVDYLVTLPGRLAHAERLVPGRYSLITAPMVTGVLAHEAFGHTQEGDTRMLGRSCATGLQASGAVVGAPGASILSNAALLGSTRHSANGSMFFDDEGQLARPQTILDEGVVKDGMNDLMSALVGDGVDDGRRQCSGRRESWRRPVMARQTNTYFTPGDASLDELIQQMGNGFIAIDAGGGMEDPKGMSLTAGTIYLEEVADGARTGRLFVGPSGGVVELSDPVPTILRGLRGKTAAYEVISGGCQKYHKETLSAGIGGPWILWEGVTCG